MSPKRLVAHIWYRPVAGIVDVGYGDVVLAVTASAVAIGLVTGALNSPGRHGGAGAAVAVLAMTIPLAWRRRLPVNAALVLAVGALVNALAVGRMVRCGPGLPTLFLTAFALGYLRRGRLLVLGWAALAVSALTQSFSDPDLQPSLSVVLLPLIAGFAGAGALLASRQRMAAELRSRNAELREQRETNARLAVAVDRQRIADDLNVAVRSRLDELAQAAAYADPADEDATREAFSRVQQMGRETLTHMREVVGALRPPTSSAPAPVLAQLGELLSRATSADARLVVSGQPESLPAGVELSGYRIVEHLLVALEDAPDARIDVAVTFTAESLEIAVRGPAAPRAERVAALAAARERTALHGGTLDATTKSGRCEAVVRLPLIAARA